METLMTEANANQSGEGFRIDDDRKADWAIREIAKHEAEKNRLVSLAQAEITDLEAMITKYEEKCINDTKYLRSCLAEYLMSVERKETKTQESYKLLHGTLVLKKPKQEITHDDEALIKTLEGTPYIKTKQTVNWAEFKKRLAVVGDKVVDTGTGEVVNGCSVEMVPGEFIVKVEG